MAGTVFADDGAEFGADHRRGRLGGGKEQAAAAAHVTAAPAPVIPLYFSGTNTDPKKPTWPDPTGGAAGVCATPGGDRTEQKPRRRTQPAHQRRGYDRIAHNLFSVNVVWTLLAGFLVMFMQAGFAMVETGLCRAKRGPYHEHELHDLRLGLPRLLGLWFRHRLGQLVPRSGTARFRLCIHRSAPEQRSGTAASASVPRSTRPGAAILRRRNPDILFPVAATSEEHLPDLQNILAAKKLDAVVRLGETPQIMQVSKICLAVSGTATLETAYFRTPMVVVYRTNKWARHVAPRLLRVPNFCLVNILAGREAVPEFLKFDNDPRPIAQAALNLLDDSEAWTQCRKSLDEVIRSLGLAGTSDRAARVVLDCLDNRR